MIDLDPLNRPQANALAEQISNRTFSGNFCGICCNQPDELWDNSPAIDSASSPDNSVIEYKEDDDDDNESTLSHDKLDQSWVTYSTGSPSIENWLSLQDCSNIDMEIDNTYKPSLEYDGLPYEVVEDEDVQEPSMRAFHLPDYLPERLSTLNIHGEGNEIDLPEDPCEVITEDEEPDLPYQIVSDDSCSEATVRHIDAPPEWLSELSDEDLPQSPKPEPAERLDKLLKKDNLAPGKQECLSDSTKAKISAAAVYNPNSSSDVANAGANSSPDVPAVAVLSKSAESSNNPTISKSPAVQTRKKIPIIAVHAVAADTSNDPIVSEIPSVQTPEEIPIIAVHPVVADTSNNSKISESPTFPTPPPEASAKEKQCAARISYKPDVTAAVTAALTAGNLARLKYPRMERGSVADELGIPSFIQPLESSLRPEPRISARSYMHEILGAESSAATSILSENTKRMLGSNLSILPWQDKSFRYLECYAKQGRAGVVRYLLEGKCSPGTRVRAESPTYANP